MAPLRWTTLLLLVSACGGAPARPATASAPPKRAAATRPIAYEVALTREADTVALKAMRVSAIDGRFEGTVLARAAPRVEAQTTDGGLHIASIELPFGAEQPMRCSVSPSRADASKFFSHFFHLVHAEAPELTVAAHASGAVLFATARYRVEGQTGGQGLVKLAIAPREIGSIGCVHDEVGYRESFKRVFLSAIEGRTSPTTTTAEGYLDVSRVSEHGKTIGFAETRARATDGGAHESTESFVALVRKEKSFAFLEGLTVTHVDKRGDLLDTLYIHMVNGALYEAVRVEKKGAGYAYTGEREGKPLAGSLPARSGAPLSSWLGQLAGLRALARGEKKELRYFVVSDTEVPAASEVVVRREGGGFVKEEGPHKSEVVLDDNGTVSRSIRGELELSRVFVRGTP